MRNKKLLRDVDTVIQIKKVETDKARNDLLKLDSEKQEKEQVMINKENDLAEAVSVWEEGIGLNRFDIDTVQLRAESLVQSEDELKETISDYKRVEALFQNRQRALSVLVGKTKQMEKIRQRTVRSVASAKLRLHDMLQEDRVTLGWSKK